MPVLLIFTDLVLNGGVNIRPDRGDYLSAAEATLAVNYFGNRDALRIFFPLIRPGGRIGMIGPGLGVL